MLKRTGLTSDQFQQQIIRDQDCPQIIFFFSVFKPTEIDPSGIFLEDNPFLLKFTFTLQHIPTSIFLQVRWPIQDYT